MNTALRGLGHYLPAASERAGVRRPIASEPCGPSTLATHAAAEALRQANITPNEVEFIVFATMTPNVTFPGAGCYFQHEMGCDTVGALDVRAQCAGFLYGLVIADRFIRSGVHRNVLVLGGEVHSSSFEYSDRDVAVARLYGDGAGAALFVASDGPSGILATAIHADGKRHRQFWCEFPSSRQHPVRMTIENYRDGKHLLAIEEEATRRFGSEAIPSAIDEVLSAAGRSVDTVDHFILSHVYPDVAESAARKLGIGESKLTNSSGRYGHLTAASLPVALSEDLAAGRIARGATVCLATAGAGATWGAALMEV